MKLCSLYLLGELDIRHLVVILKDKSRRAVPPSLCCELVLFFVCLILEMNWFCGLPNIDLRRFNIDDAVNLTSEKHDPYAQISHLHKRRKQKDLAEGTGVVPAKYLPKVKLEIFSQL